MSTRRQFMKASAAVAAGCMLHPSRQAEAADMPKLSEDDPTAQAMKYVHDASTVDPASRPNPAEKQLCSNCALIQGDPGNEWRPCPIFPGKLVNNNGWCSVWAPKT